MSVEADKAGINYSRLLQEAISNVLGIERITKHWLNFKDIWKKVPSVTFFIYRGVHYWVYCKIKLFIKMSNSYEWDNKRTGKKAVCAIIVSGTEKWESFYSGVQNRVCKF